jgi:hypothetical protein
MTHYYAAEIKGHVYFRGSTFPAFRSIWFRSGRSWGFSSDPSKGPPCSKISRKQFTMLVKLKAARVAAAKADYEAKFGKPISSTHGFMSAPTDSWIEAKVAPPGLFAPPAQEVA